MATLSMDMKKLLIDENYIPEEKNNQINLLDENKKEIIKTL
ncbi:MAG: hypothetical protein P1U46_02650 [Patescibacteria group bacterium]|nr:hypothetical protein [Patescibacteria group bacterium]